MKMIFNDLYLFSPHEKVAKRICFEDGINVITSNQQDGTDRGKSVIMRSLYHTLGAEAHFEKKWDVKDKIFILKFSVDGTQFYIYRAADLFKVFDENKKLIFPSVNRSQFMVEFSKIIKFTVLLPDRKNKELHGTPPVYSYLPFYLDQDHYDGSKYTSFKNLEQFSDFKDGVIFCHLGIYNDDYFSLCRDKERINSELDARTKRLDVIVAMRSDIEAKISGGVISADLEILKKDVNQYRDEYKKVYSKLTKIREKLIGLRDDLYETELLLQEMIQLSKKNESELGQLKKHICPECGSVVHNTLSLRSKRYNLDEDIIVVKNDLQINIQKINSEIEKKEAEYKELVDDLQKYDQAVKNNSAEMDDILRYRGLCELRDGVVEEEYALREVIDNKKDELREIQKQIKLYAEKKKKANERYCELLSSARVHFGLSELDPEKFKKISNSNFPYHLV